jgi:hypothetical protein
MKYFTKDYWLRLQDLSNSEQTEREWEQLLVAYRENLSTLRPRLSPEVMAFFDDADVHDGHLVEFRIAQPPALAAWDGSPDAEHPVTVQLTVREATGDAAWLLKYSNVRRVVVDYPSEAELFPIGGEGLGDWGYHELTDVGGGFFKHEVLFASGATLLVEFAGIHVDRAANPQDAV